MARSGKRVFLLAAEDYSPEICNGKWEAKDHLMIFTGKNKEFSLSDMEALPQKGTVHSAQEIKESAYDFESVKKRVCNYRSKSDQVYLIGPVMSRHFKKLQPFASGFAGIGKNDTFDVSGISLYKDSASGNSDTGKKKTKKIKDDEQYSLFEGTMMDTVKNAEPLHQENSDFSSGEGDLGSKSEAAAKTPKTEIKKETGKKDRKTEPNREKPSDKNAAKPNSQLTLNLQDLEAQVFGAVKEDARIVEISTPLQDAKANLSLYMTERFREHIRFHLKTELSHEQAHQFAVLILKTQQPEEFQEAWNRNEPSMAVKIGLNAYLMLRGEAEYYCRASAYIYEEDVWNY